MYVFRRATQTICAILLFLLGHSVYTFVVDGYGLNPIFGVPAMCVTLFVCDLAVYLFRCGINHDI